MTHDDLLTRLREATGADRELDAALTEAFATHPPLWKRKGTRAEWGNDHPLSSWDAPRYTASLDAAIGLVERMLPGWNWRTGSETVDGLAIMIGNSNAPTPALALLVALLEALNAQEQGKP